TGGEVASPLHFPQAPGDGVAVQPGDAVEQGDATAAVLSGQEADEEPARAFIGLPQEPVEGLMLLGGRPTRVLRAVGAFAAVRDTVSGIVPHRCGPPSHCTTGVSAIVPRSAEITFERRLSGHNAV